MRDHEWVFIRPVHGVTHDDVTHYEERTVCSLGRVVRNFKSGGHICLEPEFSCDEAIIHQVTES